MVFFERKICERIMYNGMIVNVRVDSAELHTGACVPREVVEHPGGVCVVPVDSDGNVTVVRQFRYPFMEETIEVPAGKLERCENPAECALRELHEETGLRAGELVSLGVIYPSPGFCSEVLHIYLATNCIQEQAHPDENEFLEVARIPLNKMISYIMSGDIKDAKTIVGIFKAERYLNSL